MMRAIAFLIVVLFVLGVLSTIARHRWLRQERERIQERIRPPIYREGFQTADERLQQAADERRQQADAKKREAARIAAGAPPRGESRTIRRVG